MDKPERETDLSPRERLARLLEAAAGKTPHTPAEALRLLLTQLDIRVANMTGVGPEVIRILEDLDRAAELLRHLQEEGVNVQAEVTRFTSLQDRLRAKASLFLKELGGAKALRQIRERQRPPREHTWWYLDEWLARQRRARLRRVTFISLGVILILGLVYVFIQSRLPKDPRMRRILDLEMQLDAALEEGQWSHATHILEELHTLDPNNPTYLIQLGVLYEHLGEEEKARSAYQQARKIVDEGTFYKLRAMTYVQVGDGEHALADARRAVQHHPHDPEAYFYLGNAYELLNRVPQALDAYENAARLAEAQKRDALLAVIRVRMAALLQRPPSITLTP